jgi:sugar lactone lactonase YvrE
MRRIFYLLSPTLLFLFCSGLFSAVYCKVNNPSKAVLVTTLAGTGSKGFSFGDILKVTVKPHVGVNETMNTASFYKPMGIAIDSSGNVYVADSGNNLIRKITFNGIVTTLAGSGKKGSANGIGTAASFFQPSGVAVDTSGNVYVADQNNCMIRKITPTGVVTTLAGRDGVYGSTNATATAALFKGPSGVAVDSFGNVYVADDGNNLIRKIDSYGLVTTLAGSGHRGFKNGKGIDASFNSPGGIAVDSSGNLYVSDAGNKRIRKITSSGMVTTLAGSGNRGFKNGKRTIASFFWPAGVAVDKSGNVYVADIINQLIRKITPNGLVMTLAGSAGVYGYADGIGTAALFNMPTGIAVDSSGNIYVTDKSNNLIRKIIP